MKYMPSIQVHLKKIAGLLLSVFATMNVFAQDGLNSVRTWDAVKKEKNAANITSAVAPDEFILRNVYFDGAGRITQAIVKQGSLITGTAAVDMVNAHFYDGLGREIISYLPFAANTNDGLFKANPFQQQTAFYSNPNGILKGQSENHFYGETIYDGSPLNKVLKTMASGNSWTGNNAGVEYEYQANTAVEKVHIWNIGFTTGAIPVTSFAQIYPDGQLFKNITKDENGKQVINYTDKSGNLILKKVQDKDNAASGLTNEHAGWLCTYYVYDDFGQLRFIMPPKAVVYLDAHDWILSIDVVNELCFSYEYDSRGMPVVKKSPGAAAVYMVYDARDRVVFTQDGNQRDQMPKKWLVTLYDNLDRPTLTGIIEYSGSRQDLQNHVNTTANTGSSEIVNINSSTPPVVNLLINHREQDVQLYNATESITFNPGFESEAGAGFIAEIKSSATIQTSVVQVNGNPLPPGNNLYTLTITYYDDYTYAGAKPFFSGFTIDPTVPANENEEVESSLRTMGYVTGTQVRLLDGSNTFLTTTSFYDERGRTIQVAGDNHKGFRDVITTQYDFSGKVRSTYEVNRFDGTDGTRVFTRNEYDVLGRVTSVFKSINGEQEKNIVAYTYDALGRLSKKTLAPGFSGPVGNNLESLDYSYNIQGWLLGINKEYAASSSPDGHFFGMELGYDKPGGAEFVKRQINGNIAGNAWKTKGDHVFRKYDFDYDNVGQLTVAEFRQKDIPGAEWTKNKMDFSSNYTYDENGNIKTQNQWGASVGGTSQQIDQMVYDYDVVPGGWSNRLKRIADIASSGANGGLGDFKNGTAGAGIQQYTYDPNANVRKDLNKEIGSSSSEGIAYNYMNLTTLITFKNTNKTISYVYDAAGNKLRKILKEPAHDNKPARHVETDYLNGFVYQNNELQFFMHEEGRIRKTEGNILVYDYFIKDHLSNTRMVLTEEQQLNHYPTATLEGEGEGSALNKEREYYDINESFVFVKPANVSPASLLDYKNDNGTNNSKTFGNKDGVSQKMYRLNAATNRTGYSKILKVMAGDKVNMLARSYYHYSGGTIPKNNLIAADIINALLSVAGGGNPVVWHGGTVPVLTANNSGLVLPLKSFTDNNPSNANNGVKSGLNYIVLDDNFSYVTGGHDPVNNGQSGGLKNHFIQDVDIAKNGYIYIYCANESNIDVFFDNLEVIHTRGPILEENHYYAYGLKIAAISSRAAGGIQNNYLYQGDFSEFNEESGYNEFYLRHYDPQVGRWTTTDPFEQFASPYLGMGNNPGMNIDPDGGRVLDWIKWVDAGGTTRVRWFDDFSSAKDLIQSWGGTAISNLGLSGFWQSNINGIQNWWLNSDGTATLSNLFKLSAAKMPVPALAVMKEVPKTQLGFWKTLNVLSSSNLSNPGVQLAGKILFGIANDSYIFGKSYLQGHRGFVSDLNGDLVGSKERLVAGMNTFQLAMLPADFAAVGVTSAAKGGTSLRAGRTGVKQWLQNAGNLERGQLIKDIESAGFKKVFDGKGMMHFERGGMKIRLDPPQPGTPFNHMHLELGKRKFRSSYDIFLNRVPYDAPGAHIPIR